MKNIVVCLSGAMKDGKKNELMLMQDSSGLEFGHRRTIRTPRRTYERRLRWGENLETRTNIQTLWTNIRRLRLRR